eukprot:1497615-Amphidinium_carterae.1
MQIDLKKHSNGNVIIFVRTVNESLTKVTSQAVYARSQVSRHKLRLQRLGPKEQDGPRLNHQLDSIGFTAMRFQLQEAITRPEEHTRLGLRNKQRALFRVLEVNNS